MPKQVRLSDFLRADEYRVSARAAKTRSVENEENPDAIVNRRSARHARPGTFAAATRTRCSMRSVTRRGNRERRSRLRLRPEAVGGPVRRRTGRTRAAPAVSMTTARWTRSSTVRDAPGAEPVPNEVTAGEFFRPNFVCLGNVLDREHCIENAFMHLGAIRTCVGLVLAGFRATRFRIDRRADTAVG